MPNQYVAGHGSPYTHEDRRNVFEAYRAAALAFDRNIITWGAYNRYKVREDMIGV